MSKTTRGLLSLVLLAGCAPVATQPTTTIPTSTPATSTPATTTPAAASAAPAMIDVNHDYHSYANTSDFRTRHLVLDLSVDFDHRVLSGTAELQLQRLSATATELDLDTRDLDITKVETAAGPSAAGKGAWAPTGYTVGERDPILGSALRVTMPVTADRVRITYKTHPEASGLQWVTPAQTAGKKKPFLYSQSQAIHGRSWIPLQDTPSVRSTYEAHIRTPKNLLAVMSAHNRPGATRTGDYRFEMKQAVPSYLIALAVGDLKFRPVGARAGIYAEPSVLMQAAHEFEDVEQMIVAVEKRFGPYRWERYDMLVLPPSFPYGGMENPRLTFLTPTAIIGDKSGVSLIAHELSHSWSGNLVTNATWRDFWLNEGTTTYLTNRVMDAVFGQKRGDMERVLGQRDLEESFKQASRPGDKALAFDQRGRDPDEVFSSIPYERGYLFLTYLEGKFGRERFDVFLRGWFDEHAFQSKTTEDFLAHLDEKLLSSSPGLVSKAEIDQWIYQADMPADAVYATSDVFTKVDAQRDAWLASGKLDAKKWTSHEWQHFLEGMPDSLTTAQVAALDKQFHLTASHDDAVLVTWFVLGIKHGYPPVMPVVEKFLLSVGRMRYVKPLYRELVKTPDGKAFARRVFAVAKPTYHPIGQASVERILTEAK